MKKEVSYALLLLEYNGVLFYFRHGIGQERNIEIPYWTFEFLEHLYFGLNTVAYLSEDPHLIALRHYIIVPVPDRVAVYQFIQVVTENIERIKRDSAFIEHEFTYEHPLMEIPR
ncbi:MAG: hypothetical protein JWO84_245 [Parcubacteria group bacterium]|nr:hypothetical protein [Parcubacteria group bacterium]